MLVVFKELSPLIKTTMKRTQLACENTMVKQLLLVLDLLNLLPCSYYGKTAIMERQLITLYEVMCMARDFFKAVCLDTLVKSLLVH